MKIKTTILSVLVVAIAMTSFGCIDDIDSVKVTINEDDTTPVQAVAAAAPTPVATANVERKQQVDTDQAKKEIEKLVELLILKGENAALIGYNDAEINEKIKMCESILDDFNELRIIGGQNEETMRFAEELLEIPSGEFMSEMLEVKKSYEDIIETLEYERDHPKSLCPSIQLSASPTVDGEIKITHHGGDMLTSGEWEISIVPYGDSPDYDRYLTSNLDVGNHMVFDNSEKITGTCHVMVSHIPSDALLLDTTIQIYIKDTLENSNSYEITPEPTLVYPPDHTTEISEEKAVLIQELEEIEVHINYHEDHIETLNTRYMNGEILYEYFRTSTINSYETILYDLDMFSILIIENQDVIDVDMFDMEDFEEELYTEKLKYEQKMAQFEAEYPL